MSRRAPRFLATLATLLLVACNMDFERQSQVKRPRVLAVRAEPAELSAPLSPAGPPAALQVQLFALSVSPDGGAPAVRFALCRPANPYAADFECPGKDGVDLPDGRLSLLEPAVQALTGITPPPPGVPLQPASIPLFVGFECEGERGVRQVAFRFTDAPNQNPALVDLQLDGGKLQGPLVAGEEVEIVPVLGEGSRETFLLPDGGARLEPMAFSWHATGEGRIGFFRSLAPAEGDDEDLSSTRYTPDAGDGSVTFHVVARDGRGGTAWISRTVDVR
ncbi:MAG: hypothetical protein FJ086_00750 [Deltaproteobacteria bacterium]|nr:hypothetical protein [Deltaproteobacteria bacterium]